MEENVINLNRSGTRWKFRNREAMKFTLVVGEKRLVKYADYFISKNICFVIWCYRYKDKRYSAFQSEFVEQLPVIEHKETSFNADRFVHQTTRKKA